MTIDISVIIPTRNRMDLLKDLLNSIKTHKPVKFNYEVIVINNGSSDSTISMVEETKKLFPVQLKILNEPMPGLHRCRNRGAKEAIGTVLGYLDDDMVVSSQWLTGADLVLQKKTDAVAGKILPLWRGEVPEWSHIIYDGKVCGYWGLLDLGEKQIPVKSDFIPGGNCFIRKEIVTKLKGFNPDGVPSELLKYRGDGETGFFRQFHKSGYRAMYDPVAMVRHIIGPDRLTLEYICNRSFRQGISDSYSKIRKEGIINNPFFMLIDDARKKGECYHREQVINDKKLFEWVLKKNYWDDHS